MDKLKKVIGGGLIAILAAIGGTISKCGDDIVKRGKKIPTQIPKTKPGSTADDIITGLKGANPDPVAVDVIKNHITNPKVSKLFASSVDEMVNYDQALLTGKEEILAKMFERESKLNPGYVKNLPKRFKEEYIDVRNQLSRTFDDKKLLEKFDGDVLNINIKRSFKESVKFAKKNLLPQRLKILDDSPEINDLYSILTGRKLNKEQARLLSILTGRRFLPSTNKYDNYLFAELKNGTFKINTSSSSELYDMDSFSIGLKKYRSPKLRVIYIGKLTPEVASIFSENNIKFVSNFDTIVKGVFDSPKRVKLIFVASTDEQKMSQLFQGASPRKVNKLIDVVNKIKTPSESFPNSEIVEDKRGLSVALTKAKKQGENPIVIFNNIDDKLFHENLSDLGIDHAITCNSFNMKGAKLSNHSTDFIFFDDVVKALQKVPGREAILFEDFMSRFAIEYVECLRDRNVKNAIIAATAIGTPAGVLIYAVVGD
ncbi:MAG: hypothetical protein PVH61_20910 [Candidatus Aminicenantes bacterium]|jgi:hypothetical protein